MSTESAELQQYVRGFAYQWTEASPDTPEREVQRRNYLVGVLLLAEQGAREPAMAMIGEEQVAVLALQQIYRDARWRARQRLVFASLRPAAQANLPTPAELLQSLSAADGRFRHDLSVFVP